jgi:hypothetical protein
MRKGIDDDHLTYLEAGLIAQDAGVAWVALHGRTAAERYSGRADWSAIAALKQALDVPVLGNGDIWEAEDALRMVAETGCDGVVVGRGCLGRPWLFADLAEAFSGGTTRKLPSLGEVAAVMRRHAELLVAQFDGVERDGCTDFRKHVAWYLSRASRSVPSCAGGWPWCRPCPSWTICWASWTPPSRSRSTRSGSRAGVPVLRERSTSPTAGSRPGRRRGARGRGASRRRAGSSARLSDGGCTDATLAASV